MADHEEYRIRSNEMQTNPFFKNFKEGYWVSPKGGTIVKVCASYEAKMINIAPHGKNYSTSIYPVLWDTLFAEWIYLGRKL